MRAGGWESSRCQCPHTLCLRALPQDCTHTDKGSISSEALSDGTLLQRDCVSHAEGEETGVGDHDAIVDAEPAKSHKEGFVNVSAGQSLRTCVPRKLTSHL